MAVKIRLKRMGAKKRPFYRVVVADARSPRDGRFIESVGFYDPLKNPKVFQVDDERIRHWMATGARPSDAVRELLERQGSLPATAHPVRTKVGPKRPAKAGAAPASQPAPASAGTDVAAADETAAVGAEATDASPVEAAAPEELEASVESPGEGEPAAEEAADAPPEQDLDGAASEGGGDDGSEPAAAEAEGESAEAEASDGEG
ncbi:MAG TPA: 30S ribosomal protein S16 [Candidatus Dormibacteraeota bacterium]|nr:30S ribosomal protein S16 [Candidatus Dormibacteraeota bacterium]